MGAQLSCERRDESWLNCERKALPTPPAPMTAMETCRGGAMICEWVCLRTKVTINEWSLYNFDRGLVAGSK